MPRGNREPGMPQEGKTRGSGKWSKYRQERLSDGPTWGDADPMEIWAAIVAVTRAGDALLLGGSRDGGVLVATVCSGNDRIKFYWRSVAEISSGLRELAELADGEPLS